MKKFLILSVSVICFCVAAFSQEVKPTPAGENSSNSVNPNPNVKIEPFRLLSKPRANYTDQAKKNAIEGVVRVRVQFLDSGEIGDVMPLSELPNGLTEQAIIAAKAIRFTPQRADGKPISVHKIIEYQFFIYYKENDEDLKSKAEIIEMPTPETPSAENLKSYRGKVHLLIALTKDGKIQILQVDSDLPQEFKQKAADAASKIKFNPAIHKNGKEVSQTRDIEYEFKPQNN